MIIRALLLLLVANTALAQEERSGQPNIVDNQPGAQGNIAHMGARHDKYGQALRAAGVKPE